MRLMKIEVRIPAGAIWLQGWSGGDAISVPTYARFAQEKGQRTFSSAEDASQALVKAAQETTKKC